VVVVAAALFIGGCSSHDGHTLGESVNTKLNGSEFSGHVRITATKVQRVTKAAMDQVGLTGNGDAPYFAHFTVTVDEGRFPASAASAFGNADWGLRADGALQAGPKLPAANRSAALQRVCPNRPGTIGRDLANGRTAKVCAVLLAPSGSTVEAVTYLRAAPVDEGLDGDATITWTAAD